MTSCWEKFSDTGGFETSLGCSKRSYISIGGLTVDVAHDEATCNMLFMWFGLVCLIWLFGKKGAFVCQLTKTECSSETSTTSTTRHDVENQLLTIMRSKRVHSHNDSIELVVDDGVSLMLTKVLRGKKKQKEREREREDLD